MVIQRFRPHFSGQGQQLELLCRAFVRRGLEPTVITAAYDQPTVEEFIDGYRVVRLRSDILGRAERGPRLRIRGPALAARTLVQLYRRGPFDLVHIHALTDALYGSWVWGRWQRRPVLFEMTLLGVDDAVTALESPHRLAPLRHAMFRRCDGYAAISPALERRYHDAGLPGDKLRLLPQGVDVDEFQPGGEPQARRAELGIPPTSPVLIFVGSLIHRKGVDVLLKAWSRIRCEHPEAHLVLVGRGSLPVGHPEERFWADQLRTLPSDAASRIHVLGVRDDVSRLLPVADIFVFPSRREGFGTVMIEAMACGLPCVVTDQPGITDFIFGEDETAGMVVPQEDDQKLAAAVSGLLSDPARAAQMGERARSRVVEKFNIERIADRYLEFYADLIRDVRADS
jgi:glycosyltransferase involved in cell wall biosynthesis